MTHHLCISVTLLDMLYHGRGAGNVAEWPPSPMRVFQALLAGSRAGSRDRAWSVPHAEAFRWLERLEPPYIIGPNARQMTQYILNVPNNDSDVEFSRQQRLTSKTVCPQILIDNDDIMNERQAIHYLWTIPEGEWPASRAHTELLCREARNLMALGWGMDQAIAKGHVLAAPDSQAFRGERWVPWHSHRPGDRRLRVPKQGSLEDLHQVHASFLRRVNGCEFRPPLKVSQFASVLYSRDSWTPPRSYAVFELPEGVGFSQETIIKVAASLRSLTCVQAKTDSHQFPGGSETYVAGHITDEVSTPPRFSYLPLPTIGHEHSDGMIRRLLIAEPYDGEGDHAQWAQARLRGKMLRDNHGNDRGIILDLWRKNSDAVIKQYVSESRSWASVTPVVLPGFDDGRRSKAEKLFFRAVEQAGLSIAAIKNVTLRKAPFWPGSLHPSCYYRPDYLDSTKNRKFSAWHAHLTFCRGICGPIAIGAGRHCGLGLFATIDRCGD